MLEALLGHDGHASAEELAALVQRAHPEVHLSTVYRTLEALAGAGLTTHVHLGHGRAVHHLTGDGRHHHAVCEACGTVVDLPADVFDGVRDRLEAELGFRADPHHFALVGRCRRCAGAAPQPAKVTMENVPYTNSTPASR